MTSVLPPLPPKNQTTIVQNLPPPLPPKGRQSSASSVSQNSSSSNNIQPQIKRTNITTSVTNTTYSTKTTFPTISPSSTNHSQGPTVQKTSVPPPLPPKKSVQFSPPEGSVVKSQPEKLTISSSQSTGNLNPRLPAKESASIPHNGANDEKLILRAKFNTTREPRRSNLSSADALQTTPKLLPRSLPPNPSTTSPSSFASTTSGSNHNLPKHVPNTFANPTTAQQPAKSQEEPAPLKSFKSFSAEDATCNNNDFFSPDFTVTNPMFTNKCYDSTTPTVDFTCYATDSTATRNRSMSVDSAPVPVGSVRDKSVNTPSWGNNIGYLGNTAYNTKYKGKEVKKVDNRENLAGASFTCEVTSAETVVESSKRKEKFTVYTILVRFTVPSTCQNPGNYSWRILRRYKQFFELDSKMSLYGIAISKNNELPPKNNKDKFQEDFIEYRRKRLEGYLEELRLFGWKIFADPRSTFQLLKFLAPVQFNDEKPPGFVLPFKLEPC